MTQRRDFNIDFETVFNSSNDIMYVTDKKEVLHVNTAFLKFFEKYENLEAFKKHHTCVCEFFESGEQFRYVTADMDGISWFDYVMEYDFMTHYVKITNQKRVNYFNIEIHKVKDTIQDKTYYIVVLNDVTSILTNEKNLEEKVKLKTKKLQEQNKELKYAKEQMVESEKMASLGNLVAGVSHEINTPIGVASTASSHLQEEIKQLKKLYESEQMSEEDFEEFLDVATQLGDSIFNNVDRAASLIQSFKQISVDQCSDINRKFNLWKYTKEILTSLNSELKKHKHHISLDFDKKLDINSNPGAFAQVLTNLIMNSIIHGFGQNRVGTIRIVAKPQEDGKACITYEDNGKGMTQDVKEKIFDPFFTTNRGKGGSGLGMNIVYNIVTQKLGGSITVDSDVGKGVRFTIII